jgi:hypothetical protein
MIQWTPHPHRQTDLKERRQYRSASTLTRSHEERVRLAPEPGHEGGSGQLIIIGRGTAFATDEGRSVPLAGVRIEVIRGADSGRSVTTGTDGAYELAGAVIGRRRFIQVSLW